MCVRAAPSSARGRSADPSTARLPPCDRTTRSRGRRCGSASPGPFRARTRRPGSSTRSRTPHPRRCWGCRSGRPRSTARRCRSRCRGRPALWWPGSQMNRSSVSPMSTVTFDVEAVRARFPALRQPLAFFDGPGGTQVPDSVIDAVSAYFRDSNANVSGPYETSRRTERLVTQARVTAGDFLGCTPDETVFGANMTTLNFALTRTAGRTWKAGDEIIVTKLDHDANVSPWLELAHDKDLTVRFVDIHDDTTLDLDDLERLLSDRTRVVSFPVASNAVGTVSDVRRIVELAPDAGPPAWADAVHYGPHGPIDVGDRGVDGLSCRPYKYFGPHLGLAYGRRELLESWRPYKVRPASDEPLGHRFETGTLPHEQLAGFVAAVAYIDSIGWDAIRAYERELGQRFLDGLPENVTLFGVPTMDGRVATFAFNVAGNSARAAATALGERGFAVWQGNYYALEIMRRRGIGDEGAVRAGMVHYNTLEEGDRRLDAISSL